MNILHEKLKLRPLRGLLFIMNNDAPDTSRSDAVAADMLAETRRMNTWAQQLYDNDLRPMAQESAETSRAVSQAQLDAMRMATAQAGEEADYRRRVFQPLERETVAAARGFDSEANQSDAAGKASADVAGAFAGARATAQRNLTRSGFNISDPQRAALEGDMAGQEALGVAGAETRAREGVRTIGRAMRFDAANLGRGLPSAQAMQAGLAQTSGQIAASAGMQPLGAATAAASFPQGVSVAALNGMGGAGNIYSNSERLVAQGNNNGAAAWGAFGNIAGRFLGTERGANALASAGSSLATIFSDENMKEDVRPASDEKALDAVRAIPNSEWRYKSGTPADDGGKRHTGPMAQRVAAAAGMDVAPGGKKIDVVNMLGVTHGAVRALDKKVSRIAAAVGMDVL